MLGDAYDYIHAPEPGRAPRQQLLSYPVNAPVGFWQLSSLSKAHSAILVLCALNSSLCPKCNLDLQCIHGRLSLQESLDGRCLFWLEQHAVHTVGNRNTVGLVL